MSRYTIERLIGVGGMAAVWRARRRMADGIEQIVAIKEVSPTRAHEPEVVEQFRREAKLCLELHHANVVKVYDFDKEPKDLAIVMEYIDGLDLGELGKRTKLSADVLRLLLLRVVQGLQYVHSRGLLHRDITPANIRVSRIGELRLIDLGIAEKLSDACARDDFIGTAPYASYEAIQKRDLDVSSDLYSVGAVFYELVMGEPPFGDGKHEEIAEAQDEGRGEIPPLPDDFAEDLREIITGLLQPSSTRAFRTDADLLAKLTGPDVEIASEGKLAEIMLEAMDGDQEGSGPQTTRRKPRAGQQAPDAAPEPVHDGAGRAPKAKSAWLLVAIMIAFVALLVVPHALQLPDDGGEPTVAPSSTTPDLEAVAETATEAATEADHEVDKPGPVTPVHVPTPASRITVTTAAEEVSSSESVTKRTAEDGRASKQPTPQLYPVRSSSRMDFYVREAD